MIKASWVNIFSVDREAVQLPLNNINAEIDLKL
jgi:hypothetical protein